MEPRQLLATFTVSSLADSGPGSLREAIERANLDPDRDTIAFATGLAGAIGLETALPDLSTDLAIEGPGASALAVARNPAEGGPGFRIFNVAEGASAAISGLTIAGGAAPDGGGIANAGDLALDDAVVRGNAAQRGGGLFNSGTLNVSGSLIVENAVGNRGGGIFNAGTLAITGSSLAGNSALAGPSLFNELAEGGGLYNAGSARIVNATISGNSAIAFIGRGFPVPDGRGGGIFNAGTAAILQGTIADNEANAGGDALSNTGQLWSFNTILAGTIAAGDFRSGGGNLFTVDPRAASDPAGVSPTPTDRIDASPLLGPLADNGGATPTHALLPGSPAIDAAIPLEGITADQRGIPRPQGAAPDIGAFESRGFDLTIVSGNNQDTPVGTPFPEPLTVRATGAAGEPVSGGVVRFESGLSGATARLVSPAVIGPDGLASTPAVASTFPGAYSVIATSSGAAPVEFTLTNRVGALEVVNVARVGFHNRPTRIDLTFNAPLDAAQASRVENYRLLGPGLDRAPGVRPDRPLRLRSASFDARTNTVSLVPAEPLRLLGGRRYLVVVDGAVETAFTSRVGTTAVVGAEDFVPSPALARQLRQVQRLQRFRDGTGRLR